MLVVPKIIVFTSDENGFIEYNPDYYDNENKFYSFGGIATDFQKVKNFLNDEKYNRILIMILIALHIIHKILALLFLKLKMLKPHFIMNSAKFN